MRTIRSIKDLKVGDKFVVVKEKSGYCWNIEGRMDKYLGETLNVSGVCSDSVTASETAYGNSGSDFWWYGHMINWEETERINNIPQQPHKSLLKSGDKVVYRNGSIRFVLLETNSLHERTGRLMCCIDEFGKDLTWIGKLNDNDIMEIWRGEELIAKRIEKSANEIEIERIKNEMLKLSEQQNQLAKDLEKLEK